MKINVLKLLRAVTVIVPLVEGLAYAVGKAVRGVREAFGHEESSAQPPEAPGGVK